MITYAQSIGIVAEVVRDFIAVSDIAQYGQIMPDVALLSDLYRTRYRTITRLI